VLTLCAPANPEPALVAAPLVAAVVPATRVDALAGPPVNPTDSAAAVITTATRPPRVLRPPRITSPVSCNPVAAARLRAPCNHS